MGSTRMAPRPTNRPGVPAATASGYGGVVGYLPDEFRVNHRAASESLQKAAAADDLPEIEDELQKAEYFEGEAMRSLKTQRQRALAIGFLHTVDLIRAVAHAELGQPITR